jgi:hypothetical protein
MYAIPALSLAAFLDRGSLELMRVEETYRPTRDTICASPFGASQYPGKTNRTGGPMRTLCRLLLAVLLLPSFAMAQERPPARFGLA